MSERENVLSENIKLPESCKEHQPKYHEGIWQTYSIMELGMWVHLFSKRALHRKDKIKARKDVTDAQNYLNMMQAKIDEVRQKLTETFDKP